MSTAARRSELRERRGEIREQIIAAATRALRERPYRELSVEELMASAGLTRTLFYRHFDDLGDLVARLLAEASAELYEHERRLAMTAVDEGRSIRDALEPAVRTLARHGPLLRAIMEAASHDDRIERGYREMADRFGALIEGYLQMLVDTGRAQLADPTQTARALNLMNLSYLLDAFGASKPKVTREVAVRTLVEIWEGTIAYTGA
jgi:TetR/AcrR family transcriptional regulator, ethionamide resistance regulator